MENIVIEFFFFILKKSMTCLISLAWKSLLIFVASRIRFAYKM